MSPEIRIKRIPKGRRGSFIDILGTLLVLIFFVVGYLKLPENKSIDLASEYNNLENTGQLLLSQAPLESEVFEKVLVTKITDGDTIKAKRTDDSEIIVRYIGIDTPEIKHQGNGTDEPFGQAATAMNSWLVLNKYVYLQRDATETDRYGRLLRYVYLENGAMVNYIMIRLGYASIMTIPPNVAFQQRLFAGQELAKEEGLHLFAPNSQ